MEDVEAARRRAQDSGRGQERGREQERQRGQTASPALGRASEGPEHPPRVTAAAVRRNARSELEAELARQLVDCRGNLAEVARRMGRDRSTIRYHLRRFGMLTENGPERPASRTSAGRAEAGRGAGPGGWAGAAGSAEERASTGTGVA